MKLSKDIHTDHSLNCIQDRSEYKDTVDMLSFWMCHMEQDDFDEKPQEFERN